MNMGLFVLLALVAFLVFLLVNSIRRSREFQRAWNETKERFRFSSYDVYENKELVSYLRSLEVFQQGKARALGSTILGSFRGWTVLLVHSSYYTGILDETEHERQVVAVFIDGYRDLRLPWMQLLPWDYQPAVKQLGSFLIWHSRLEYVQWDQIERESQKKAGTDLSKSFASHYRLYSALGSEEAAIAMWRHVSAAIVAHQIVQDGSRVCIESRGRGIAVWLRGEAEGSELPSLITTAYELAEAFAPHSRQQRRWEQRRRS